MSEKGVENKSEGDQEQGPSDCPTGGFKGKNNSQSAEGDIPLGWLSHAVDKFPKINADINCERKTQCGQYKIDKKKCLGIGMFWIEGIMDKGKCQRKTERVGPENAGPATPDR